MRRAVMCEGNLAVYEDGKVNLIIGNIEIPANVRDSNGYCVVCTNSASHSVHRLVAQAFLPNPEGKREVNHKDGNKKNNSADNLEWVTHKENMEHAYKTGLCTNKRSEKTIVYNLKALRALSGWTQQQLADISGVDRVSIAKYEAYNSGMTVDTAVRLANALNCTIDDLINKDEKHDETGA